ncbi:antibiotic acetyltransferase [Alteromonas aestuariivivens]|uniref:Antibiotic acetyltransferase n=1 Tax=Alteromonas aestuariivivens TaxID=1938339 RepID=A0A3D8M9C5_9ALTE|nr:CatB-related O-acetyltransferase [Alteromonas aestuariivivens]RDV26579.1 antibiotic acetyltransferase [Alteromonas aestuariivivens]
MIQRRFYKKSLEHEFKNKRIFFSQKGRARFIDGQRISFYSDSIAEPYTGYFEGSKLYTMGSFSYSWSELPEHTVVGRYCSIASGVSVMGEKHPIERFSSSAITYNPTFILSTISAQDAKLETTYQVTNPHQLQDLSVNIGNDVWIGHNVTLATGITIGDGAVIATRAVVTKDVPPYAVVAGVPAKIVKYRFNEKEREKLQNVKWWEYAYWDFKDISADSNPTEYCLRLEEKIAANEIEPYSPKSIPFVEFFK